MQSFLTSLIFGLKFASLQVEIKTQPLTFRGSPNTTQGQQLRWYAHETFAVALGAIVHLSFAPFVLGPIT